MTLRTGWMLAAALALAGGPRALADDEHGAKQPQTSGAAQPGSAAKGSGRTQDTQTPITGTATTESGKAGHVATEKGNTEVIRGLYAQNALDLETARLAKTRSQDEQVKQLADSVERDHKRLGEKLEELASGRGLELSRAQALEGGRRAHLEDMKNMSASEFDRHFGEMMAADHQKLLKQLGTALDQASTSGDRELAAVLQEFKPVFQQHQQSATTLSGKTERGSLGSGAEAADAPARDAPAEAEPREQPKAEGERKGY